MSSTYSAAYDQSKSLDNNVVRTTITQTIRLQWIEPNFGDDVDITTVVLNNRILQGWLLDEAVVTPRAAMG